MAVDAYIPDIDGVNQVEAIGPVSPPSTMEVEPGEEIELTVEVRNLGTEAVDNGVITIPLPYSTDYVSCSAEYYFPDEMSGTQPYYSPTAGPTGSIIWNIGYIPYPPNLDPPGDASTLLAKITYKVKATTDCFILSNPHCVPTVSLVGSLSGTGATSQISFTKPLIRGYETSGPCESVAITTPMEIIIDRDDYIAQNCQPPEDYETRSFTFCNISGATIPFMDVYPFFPAGSTFFDDIETDAFGVPSGTGTEYTITSGFPASSGMSTYYAIPPGNTTCWWEFTINVIDMTTTPTTEPVTYCVGDEAAPLTATPTDPSYDLYYYYSET
jgi:uncharacterized repeat protein (TIGR01451 family)